MKVVREPLNADIMIEPRTAVQFPASLERACSFGSYSAHGAGRSSGFIPIAFVVIATAERRAAEKLAESVSVKRAADIDSHLRDEKIIVTVSGGAASSAGALSWGIIVPEKLLLAQRFPHPLPLRSLSMMHRENSFSFDLYELPGSRCTRIRLSGQVQNPPTPRSLRHWLTQMARWSGQPVELVLSADSGTVAWFEWWGDVMAEVPSDLLSVRFVDSTQTGRWMRGR